MLGFSPGRNTFHQEGEVVNIKEHSDQALCKGNMCLSQLHNHHLLWRWTTLICTCSPWVLNNYRFKLCVLCFSHPLKKKKILRNKVIRQTSCFGFYQEPVVQVLCWLIWPEHCATSAQLWDTEMYAPHRGENCWKKEDCFWGWIEDEQLGWALCLP